MVFQATVFNEHLGQCFTRKAFLVRKVNNVDFMRRRRGDCAGFLGIGLILGSPFDHFPLIHAFAGQFANCFGRTTDKIRVWGCRPVWNKHKVNNHKDNCRQD